MPSYADLYKRVVPFVDDRNVPIPLPKNKTVCQDYLKLLNYHARKNVPLSCERPIPPGWTNFSQPEWKELDLKENEELLKKIDRFYRNYRYFVSSYEKDFDEEKWLARIQYFLDSQSAYLYQTEIDLNGDGRLETVVKYVIEPFCEPRRGDPDLYSDGPVLFFVIDETNSWGIRHLRGLVGNVDILFYQGEVFLSSIDVYGNIYLNEVSEFTRDPEDIFYKTAFYRVCKFSFSKSK